MMRLKQLTAAPQQLLSLVQWRQQALAIGELGQAAACTTTSRAFASEPHAATRFSKERKEYERSLSDLRKQWAQERAAQLEQRAAAEAVRREAREAARAQRQQQQQVEKGAKLQAYLARQEEERRIRMEAKQLRLQRQQLREEVLDIARDERRQWLLQQSKHWITAESLDARIDEALSNPVPLFTPRGSSGGAPRQQQQQQQQ